MPYCLSCGAKTDFETETCHSCGQAIRHRIDPPGDDFGGLPEPEVPRDDADGADADESDTESAAAATTDADDDAVAPGEDDDAAVTASDATSDTAPPDRTDETPTTAPAGASPFANRWALPFAAGYPIRDDYRPLTVGGVLTLLGLFVPLFLLVPVGYGFRLLRAVARGQADRPAFAEYGQLFVEGLKCAFVVGIYGFVAFVGVIGAVLAGSVDEPLGAALWIVVGVLAVYPLPASLTVYGATDDLRSAFARGHAGRFATSWTYLQAWLGWLVALAGAALLVTLSVVTLLGPLIVWPWAVAALGALWGHYYRKAVARGTVPPAPDDPVA